MIGLDKAKRLKEAGLKWEPKKGDWYFYPNGEFEGRFLYDGSFIYTPSDIKGRLQRWWLPRLDQLLTEIKARGHKWSLKLLNRPQYRVILYPEGFTPGGNGSSVFTADTPEDAAAEALIWILEQEASHDLL